jgi:hypothetical protein
MDALEIILTVAALFLLFYYLQMWLRSDAFWYWIFGLESPSKSYERKPYIPRPWPLAIPAPSEPEPPKARIKKDLGPHHNPSSLNTGDCKEAFEQFDMRTWQCPKCLLLHFEKPTEAHK